MCWSTCTWNGGKRTRIHQVTPQGDMGWTSLRVCQCSENPTLRMCAQESFQSLLKKNGTADKLPPQPSASRWGAEEILFKCVERGKSIQRRGSLDIGTAGCEMWQENKDIICWKQMSSGILDGTCYIHVYVELVMNFTLMVQVSVEKIWKTIWKIVWLVHNFNNCY